MKRIIVVIAVWQVSSSLLFSVLVDEFQKVINKLFNRGNLYKITAIEHGISSKFHKKRTMRSFIKIKNLTSSIASILGNFSCRIQIMTQLETNTVVRYKNNKKRLSLPQKLILVRILTTYHFSLFFTSALFPVAKILEHLHLYFGVIPLISVSLVLNTLFSNLLLMSSVFRHVYWVASIYDFHSGYGTLLTFIKWNFCDMLNFCLYELLMECWRRT